MQELSVVPGCEPLGLYDVIQAIGSDVFGTCLAKTLRHELGIDQLMVFHTSPALSWQTLIAYNVNGDLLASRLATAYTTQFWTRDPKRHVPATLLFHEAEIHTSEDLNVVDRDYRRALFLEPRLVDKISVFFRTPLSTFYINLYHGGVHGAFKAAEIERLRLTRGVLSALIEKHATLLERSQTCSLEQLQVVFGQEPGLRGARLSDREIQTCARIVLGYSSEAIALDLGMSLHSAVTYRKRAFAKLGIATQHELFAIVLKRRRLLDHGRALSP